MDILVENIESITIIIYCLLIGIAVAFIVSLATRGIYGKLVDALIRERADNEVSAKTLDDLGIKKSPVLIKALERKTTLSSLVSCDDENLDADKRHYYIIPERQIKAQSLFGTEKVTPVTIVAVAALFAGIVVFMQYILPKML